MINRPTIEVRLVKGKLLQLISGLDLVHDRIHQPPCSFGKFSVNSWYKFLNYGGLQIGWSSMIWNSIAPLKIEVFLQMLMKDRLHTKNHFIKKGWYGDPFCVFCGCELETRDHVFLNCEFAQDMWMMAANFFDSPQLPNSLKHLLLQWSLSNIWKQLQLVWRF